MSGATTIEIGSLALELPADPRIDAGLFARHLELELTRLDLPELTESRHVARLDLPPLAARPGDTAVTLARRVGAAIGREIARAAGGRP